MNILIITQWFNPEPNNMKALSFAKRLRDKGNDVQVLTGFPNYPTGKIYEGYKLKRYQKEVIDDIVVHRVYLYPSHDRNKWKRMLNYFSFGISASIIGKRKIKGDIDVIYVYHPPITSTIAAFSISKKKKAKVVLDINDLWPDSISSTGMMSNKKILKIINKWCDKAYSKADAINVLSDGIKRILIERNVPTEKINVIPVWCNEDILSERINGDFFIKNSCADKFTVIYAGAMGEAQGLETVINGAKELQDVLPKLQLLFIGTGTCAEKLKCKIEDENIKNVKILPPVSSEEVVPILNCADVLLVNLKKDDLFSVTIPSKIPLYMATKKMIIAGLEGDGAKIIKDANCGIVFESGSIEGIKESLTVVYNMTKEERDFFAERGYDYYRNNLSFESGINAFNDLFKSLIC